MKILVLLAAVAVAALAGDITGVVVDARGGEALARVRVQLVGTEFQTSTDAGGRFSFTNVPPGDYTLHVETVGYRLLKRPFTLAEGENKDFQVILSPDTFRRTDAIEVRADPFEMIQSASPTELNLSDSEINNLGTVIVNDPVRAVQSLPGVTANNDYYSQFSVYGAPYSTIGLYWDDILLHAPFHTIQGIRDSGSISILSGDSIESLSLMPVAFPPRYMDRVGSVLDIRTREGSRTRPSFRVAATVAQVNVLAEGPLPRNRRGSWLVGVRKSYVQYVVRRMTDDPAQAIGYTDGQTHLVYDLTSRQQISLHASAGTTDYDRSQSKARYGVNTLMYAEYRPVLARAGWRFTPGPSLLVSVNGAFMQEKYANENYLRFPLGVGTYGEWTGSGNLAWNWASGAAIEAGWSARRIRSEGFDNQYINTVSNLRVRDQHRGNAVRQGGYLQQSWTTPAKRMKLSVGFRYDWHDRARAAVVSPHASAGFGVTSSTQVHVGWGQYVQFPEVSLLTSPYGGYHLLPERATHYVASVEQRLGRAVRIRVEGYQRETRDRIARPFADPRLVNGRVVGAQQSALYYNSVRGYARGVQFLVQSRSANRLSGWVSYTLGYARNRDGVEGTHFWDENDQRHTFSSYLSYRLTPSWNLSGKWVYGSGNPLPGFFRKDANGVYYLTNVRNEQCLGAYERVDLRLNRSFIFDRWKLTLYGELINATNHKNPRYTSFDGVDTRTGRAYLTIQRVFPILPSGGIMLEF